jgi:hypothetical protein
MKMKWLSLVPFFLLSALGAKAQIINAVSCNEGDVSTALSSITADGTTVVVPAGNCTWTVSLSYTQLHSFTLQGAGAISGTGSQSTISGSGTDSTIIQDNINHSSGDSPLLNINTISGKSFRMTGIAFTYSSSNTTVTGNGSIRIYGQSSQVRIDHDHFNQMNNVDLRLGGGIQGVVDHCQFDAGFDDENLIRFSDENWNGDAEGLGNGSWNDTSHFGTGQFMFAENNNFQSVAGGAGEGGPHAFAFDIGIGGGRGVFRYNAVGYHVALQTHGTNGGTQDYRGLRAAEVYQNTFVWSSNPTADQFAFLVQLEGGASLWWGNVITGFNQFLHLYIARVSNATYAETAPPAGWGYCGTAQTGSASGWDENTNSSGYACLDGIGRGKGDLLQGTFPNKCDKTLGCSSYNGQAPNQALEPLYSWENTYNAVPQEPDHYSVNVSGSALSENRDYYLQLPNYDESATFNGAAGIGQGLLSARPSTCTLSVAYWATDKNTLYQCSATNTWTAYYTPYTYPHPLVTGSGTAPASPTGLQAVTD